MNSAIRVLVPQVEQAIQGLRGSAASLKIPGAITDTTNLSAFSPVSGLDMAGRTHGTISGHYQPLSTKALASHILDAAALLESNLANTVRADLDLSSLFGQLAAFDSLPARSAATALSAPTAAPTLANATTGRFANAAPIAGPQFSLAALHHMLTATSPAHATAAAAQWTTTASTLTSAVAALENAKANLAASAPTSWVAAAIDRVNRIQWAGATYSAHAAALATHTGNLAALAQAQQINTAVAHGIWMSIPEPEAKLLFEQSYLAPFAGALTTGLVPTNPTFNQLLPPLSDMPGTLHGAPAPTLPHTPAFTPAPLPTRIASAFAQHGYGDLARASTPHETLAHLPNPTPDTLHALAEGATPTQAAALNTPSMPPTLTPHAPTTTAPLATGAGVGPTPHATAPALPLATPPAGFNSSPAQAGAIPPGAYGRGPAGASRALGAKGLAPHATAASPTTPRFSGVNGGSLLSSTPGGALNAAPGTPPATAATPATGNTASANSAPRNYAVAPSAPAPGARAQRGKANTRVTAVTSAVEREGNLRALLGATPPTLPNVIGLNVTRAGR